MTTSRYPSSLAFAVEGTPGTPPADAAAWLAGGTRVRHISESIDTSGLVTATVDDMRSQIAVFHLNQKVRGLRNSEFPHDAYLTGSGATTAPASQIATNPLATMLAHSLGAGHRSNSTLLTGGTAAAPTVTALTNIPAGCLVGFVDTSAGDGIVYPRRVVSLGALTLNLDEVLPFVPAAGDICVAYHTISVDEPALILPTTWAWHIQRGLAAALENWVAMGCKTGLNKIALSRGALPLLSFHTLAANYIGPQSAPSPAWTGVPAGSAPVPIGPSTEWQYQTVGNTAANRIQCYSFELDVGVPVTPIDTNGEVNTNMQGRQGYATAPADTLCRLGMDFSSAAWTQFEAGTLKYLRFSKLAQQGQSMTIYLQNCDLLDPKRGANGDVSATDVVLRAMPDPTGATSLLQSKILIGFG